VEVAFDLPAHAQCAQLWDPWTGRTDLRLATVNEDARQRKLILDGYGSAIVEFGPAEGTIAQSALPDRQFGVPIGPWRVLLDGPEGSLELAPAVMDLRAFANEHRAELTGTRFSYSAVVTALSSPSQGSMWIELGDVTGVAEVAVNGQHCGRRIMRPYRFDVTEFLTGRENRIDVAVTVPLANVIRAKRRSGSKAPDPRVNIDPLALGLLGPTQLCSARNGGT
jgi:hypothetical protein